MLKDDYQVTGFIRVVATLNLQVIFIDTLHLWAISLQKVYLLLCHRIEARIIPFIAHIYILYCTGARLDLFELQATYGLIEPPLLQIEFDFADRRLFD